MKRVMMVVMLAAMASMSSADIISDAGTLYLRLEADAVGATDGAPVNSWTDLVSSQVFSGSATYDADWMGTGHAAMSFNGVDEMMSATLSGAPAMNGFTMIVFGVWRSDVQEWYDYMTSGTGTDRMRVFEDHGGVGTRIDGSGTVTSGGDLGYGDAFAIAVRSGTSYLDMWIADIDGNFDWHGTTSVATSSYGIPKLNLAANDAGTEFSDVAIMEVLIYEGGVGSGDIRTVTDYLHETYTIPEPATLALLGLGGLLLRRRK